MGFAQWLRSNSEHYLAIDAQRRTGARYGARMPEKARSLRDRFWMHVFTPAYRLLPWGFRRRVIGALPGSHRRDWPVRSGRPQGPAI
ncbi:MAG: hypothetical protein J4F50_09355 [Acidimicrobiia bacterium]|nr:hypothetical protein [Acidimicrobiia bacterium]